MNKTASVYGYVFGAIGLIILIIGLGWLFGLGSGTVNSVNRCADAHCFSPADGCPQDLDEKYTSSKLKCDDKKLVCCTPESDPLSIQAKSEEKNNNGSSTPDINQAIGKNTGKISIFMNNGLQELPSGSLKNIEIGKEYTFRISATGTGSDKCLIRVLGKDEFKVDPSQASWLRGAISDSNVDCKSEKIVTIGPAKDDVINKQYTLEVILSNSTTKVLSYSKVVFTFVASEETNKVVVTNS
jgi:hypothetical protein